MRHASNETHNAACPPPIFWEARENETAFDALLRQLGTRPLDVRTITARWFRSFASWMIMSVDGKSPPEGHWQKFTREGEQTSYGASGDESKGGGSFAIACEIWPEEWGPAPAPEQIETVDPSFTLDWKVAHHTSPLEALQKLESGPAVIEVAFDPGGTGQIIEIDKRQAPIGHRFELYVGGQSFDNVREALGQTATARLCVASNEAPDKPQKGVR